jgi:hypothetical protein
MHTYMYTHVHIHIDIYEKMTLLEGWPLLGDKLKRSPDLSFDDNVLIMNSVCLTILSDKLKKIQS